MTPPLTQGFYVYERTTGTEDDALQWVARYGPRAVYLVDHIIKGAFY